MKPIMVGFNRVLMDVASERARQEERHPDDTCWELGKNPWAKVHVLGDEVNEVYKALHNNEPIANLRAELIQVAAVCVAWVQALDRAEEAKSWPT